MSGEQQHQRYAATRVVLKEVGESAAPQLAALHRQVFGPRGWDASTIAEMLRVQGTEALLALQGGQPRGLIITRMLWGDGEILTLGVHPSFRRRGLGGRLLASAINGMVMSGANRVFLEVAEDNTAAIALYESMKFERLGRRPNYYLMQDGRRVDALMMARVFGAGCGG